MIPVLALAGCDGAPDGRPSCDEDRDGDGFCAALDCDDSDPDRHPGAEDPLGDGVDDDCDGYDAESDSLADFDVLAPEDPPRSLQLGHDFAVGDVTGDGAVDVLAGSQHAGADYGAEGHVWLFDGATRAALGHWVGGFGPQTLGQTVAIARGADGGDPQLVMRSLEGMWVVSASAPSGYPGDVGGFLLGHADPDDYLAGNRVAAIDLLDDTADDVIAECGLDTPNGSAEAVCVHVGPISADVPIGDAAVIIDGSEIGSAFAGPDLDGDGQAELAVGADDALDLAGEVHAFPGPLTPGHYDLALEHQRWAGENPGDWLGGALVAADLDDDGVEELLATAMGWPDHERRGRLYALTPAVAEVADAPLIVDGDPGLQHLGVGAAAEDLDGDGSLDLAVGAPGLATLDPEVRGRVLVFYGPVDGHLDSADAGRIFAGAVAGDDAGTTVRVGDISGDGAPELLVAAPRADLGATDSGVIYVLEGPVVRW